MMRYSVGHRDRIFVKGYKFLSFAKNISGNIGKLINIGKYLRSRSCDSSEAYILVKRTITITEEGVDAAGRQADKRRNSI